MKRKKNRKGKEKDNELNRDIDGIVGKMKGTFCAID